MTANVARHSWVVEPAGNGYRARCECGWQGRKRAHTIIARSVGEGHEAFRAAFVAKLRELSDDELRERKQRAWKDFQLVSRGSSTKAVDARWSDFVACRDELRARGIDDTAR